MLLHFGEIKQRWILVMAEGMGLQGNICGGDSHFYHLPALPSKGRSLINSKSPLEGGCKDKCADICM